MYSGTHIAYGELKEGRELVLVSPYRDTGIQVNFNRDTPCLCGRSNGTAAAS